MEYFVKPKRTLSYGQALTELTECFSEDGTYEDSNGECWTLGETLRNHQPRTYNPIVAIQWLGDFRAQIWELDSNGHTNSLVAEIY